MKRRNKSNLPAISEKQFRKNVDFGIFKRRNAAR